MARTRTGFFNRPNAAGRRFHGQQTPSRALILPDPTHPIELKFLVRANTAGVAVNLDAAIDASAGDDPVDAPLVPQLPE